MYLEAVTVCVEYSDFLAHTLPQNKQHFDKYVVVTSKKDKLTQRLCEFHNVEVITTDAFYEDGNKFNKGKGINIGLSHLSMKGWAIHLDADIYLPPLTRSILEKIDLREDTIYGVDRMMCPDYESWMKYICNPTLTHEGWIYIHPNVFPMGVRIAEYHSKGYEPIGFFQLWNPGASGVITYPDTHGAADRTDVLFAKKFERKYRGLIPEIIGIHLESENLNMANMGKNWNGRRTAPFGPVNMSMLIDQSVLSKIYGK